MEENIKIEKNQLFTHKAMVKRCVLSGGRISNTTHEHTETFIKSNPQRAGRILFHLKSAYHPFTDKSVCYQKRADEL